jgi:hypothetical protein
MAHATPSLDDVLNNTMLVSDLKTKKTNQLNHMINVRNAQ